MNQGRLEAAEVYALFEQMGLRYGPGHQGITAVELGEKQSLAHLRLPADIEANRLEYVLHPGLVDSALQASIGLLAAENLVLDTPRVPFLLDSLRVVSACTAEMFAWVRYSNGTSAGPVRKVDIDMCDHEGNVCIQMRGFATRDIEKHGGVPLPHTPAIPPPTSPRLPIKQRDLSFDRDYYRKLVAAIANHELTVDEALRLK